MYRNPYSAYLPANNPSFEIEKKKGTSAQKVLGMGGSAVGGIIGAFYGNPAMGAKIGGSIGGKIGKIGDGTFEMGDLIPGGGMDLMSSGGERSPEWYMDQNAKSAAASMLGDEDTYATAADILGGI